jgi:hypothetical protein
MTNIVIQLILTALSPIIAFLKSIGVWDDLTRIYNTVSPVFSSIFSWIGSHLGFKSMADLFVSFIRLVIDIFIVLFDIIVKAVNWVGGLFH